MRGRCDAFQPPLIKPLIDDAENFGEEDESAVQSTSMWKSAGKKLRELIVHIEMINQIVPISL